MSIGSIDSYRGFTPCRAPSPDPALQDLAERIHALCAHHVVELCVGGKVVWTVVPINDSLKVTQLSVNPDELPKDWTSKLSQILDGLPKITLTRTCSQASLASSGYHCEYTGYDK